MGPLLPPDILAQAADAVRNGANAIVFANDDLAFEMFVRHGKQPEDITDFVPIGCYEPAIMGKELCCSMSALCNMVKPFEDAAFSVPVGELSGVVETPYGFHILQIVDRKKETRPLDEAKADIEAQLKQGKQQAAFTAFLTKLKDKAGFKTVGF